jgi:hypothetical protein
MIGGVDLTFWLVWAVLFAGVVLLIYKFLPVRSVRQGFDGTGVGARRCSSGAEALACFSALCPLCGVSSTPWISHRGSWWRRESGDVYLWLDEKKGKWRRYRRASACPYCSASMAVHERRCRECGRGSNPSSTRTH